jgi:hypothetical protein
MLRPRTTVSLLVAVAVCGLLLWVLEQPAVRRGPLTAGRSGRLLPYGLQDVSFLLVEREGLRLELRREPGGWRIEQPFPVPADGVAVQRLLDLCEAAPCLETLTARDQTQRALGPADFGLAVPRARVVFGDAARRAEILFGAESPVAGQVYVCFSSSPDVFVTASSLLAGLPDAVESLRDRALFRGDAKRITGVSLRRAGQPFVALSRERGGWRIVKPCAARADDGAVGALLDAVCGAQVARFLWPSSDTNAPAGPGAGWRAGLAAVGLDRDANPLQVQLREAADPVGTSLLFGEPVPSMPDHVHALDPDGRTVVAVTGSVRQALLVPLAALRDRRVFADAAGEPQSVDLQYGDRRIGVRRTAGTEWELSAPVRDRADAQAVTRLLGDLLRLRAEALVDNAAGEAVLLASNAVCSLDAKFGDESWRLYVFPPAEGTVLARLCLTNSTAMYLVPVTNLPDALRVPPDASAFRDRRVLAVAAADVRGIAVRGADGRVESVLRDTAAAPWRTAPDGSGTAADDAAIAVWLPLLSDLRAARVASLELPDPARCGLQPPWLEVTLDLASSDALRKVLAVGAPCEGGGRYAALRGHDVLFVLPAEALRVLDRPLVRPLAPAAPAAGNR